ncbi:MAG: PspC domain-containing protein [Ilumatobacteraceae bacterium]
MSSLPPPRPPERVLRRSRDDRVIAGVAGGLGRYLDVDPVIVRVAFVVLVFFGGTGIIAYLVGWLVIPAERGDDAIEPAPGAGSSTGAGPVVVGIVLVAVGGLLLLDQVVPGFRSLLGPLLLIALGVLVLWRVRR